MKTLLNVYVVASVGLVSVSVPAFQVGGEYMTSWSGCETAPQDPLNYTDDVINLWLGKISTLGGTQKFKYGNSAVWASDMTEDKLGGEDHLYADSVDFYALSSHGWAGPAGNQDYLSPTCNRGTIANAWWSSYHTRWDESPSNPDAAPNPGWARWVMLATCYSVHTEPNSQWGVAMDRGGDVVMGYRGLSADSSRTDEVGEDLAEAVFNDGDTFKAGWFWAIEDMWGVDDTGSIVAAGSTSSNCNSRLNGLHKNSTRRGNSFFPYKCWSWHEG